jgi:hypothetical protein
MIFQYSPNPRSSVHLFIMGTLPACSEIAWHGIPGKICRVKGAEGWNDLPRPLLLTIRAR